MIIATWKDLRPLINKDISASLILKAWHIHDIRVRVGCIRFDKLEEHGTQFCNQNQLDPDTTLMIYQMPHDNPNGDPVSDEIFDREIGGLTLGNHTTCVCCFYPNMTLNKLANSINQICNLKAFL
jgi:hypothetical protein